ncbi:MAG: tetratricopeptide repeat protein [Paramuribaculum sp.]|nr:tetratricopeptide repeat protein [Paramuribaculum sp.]
MVKPLQILIAITISLIATGCGAQKSTAPKSEPAKSDYIFLEALRAKNTDARDSYYELTKRAYELNPEDSYLGFEHGYNMMMLSRGDSAALAQGYELMGRYVDEEPDDFYSSLLYAAISSQIGERGNAISTWGRLHDKQPDRPELAVRYAEVLASSGDRSNIEKALSLYDTLEIAQGTNLQITSRKIQLQYMQNDTAAMLNEARKLLMSSPLTPEYNIFAGDVFNQLGQPDSAIAFYNKAVEIDPSNGLAYYSRAMFYKQKGDSIAYDREIFRALEQENLDIEPKVEILREYTSALYNDSVQHPRINRMFSRLLEMHPHDVTVRNLYRDYLIAIEDYAQAAEQAEFSLDLDPNDENQWLALTSLYLRLSDFKGAIRSARRGQHFFPDNTTSYLLSATALNQTGDYVEAEADLRKALNIADPNDTEIRSELYTALGDNFYARELTDSAFIFYDKAIELNPANLTALNNCAYYLACTGRDLDKAEDMILRVVAERPDDATSLDTYAWVLFKKKNYGGAMEIIDDALEKTEEPSAELYDHAGDISFMNQYYSQAVAHWKKALELEPDNELIAKKVKYKTYFSK